MSDTKVVYQIDAAGVYVGQTQADRSPLDREEVYLIPAGCVEGAPPAVTEGHVAQWSGDAWTIVDDHRGETWYLDGKAVRITAVGDPSASGYVASPPDPTPVVLKDHAAAKRFAVETGGIAVAGVTVLTDRESQRLIADAASYVSTYGVASIDFKSAAGFVALSAEAVATIAQAVGAHVQASFSAERAVDAAIDAGTVTTTAEIDAWGWPNFPDRG